MDNKCNRTFADNPGTLGTPAHYNGLLFGNMTATQADCEGALAVGGEVCFGSGGHGYDVGGAGLPNTESVMIGEYKNPDDLPTLLVGETVSEQCTSANVYAGALVLRDSYRQAYEAGPFHIATSLLRYEEDALIAGFFDLACAKSLHTAEVLLNGSERRITAAQLRALNTLDHSLYRGDFHTDKRVGVFTLDCGENEAITVGEIDFDSFVMDYDLLVINLPARSVTFTGGAVLYEGAIVNTSLPRMYEGNKVVALLAGKVVFNLPNARQVVLNNYGVTGSLFAPRAAVSGNGGSVNGMLVADSLLQDGGMELHAFTIALADLLWELEVDGPYGQISLRKTDADGGRRLEDALFSLYEYDPRTGDSTWISDGATDPDGELVFYDLEPGWYRIAETCSPPGYVRSGIDEWIVELTLDTKGAVTQLETIIVRNQLAKGSAEFLKRDYNDTRTRLPGAVFDLYRLNEESGAYSLLQEGLVTGRHGHLVIPDLLVGSYRLVETQAPAGYHLREGAAVDFAIEQDAHGDVKEFERVDILNQKLASVQLVKRDAGDAQTLLPGAVFTLSLYDGEGGRYVDIATGLTTDENGQLTLTDLAPGRYKLTETAAPAGYYLETDAQLLFEVAVDGDGWLVPPAPLSMTNKQLGRVRIVKVDEDDETVCLEGAVFSLYKRNEQSGEYELLRADLRTDADGELILEGLEPGAYKLIETRSPRGYVLPAIPEVTFDIAL